MTKTRLFKLICLILYILCAVVLIVESSMDGKSSAGQSNAVGGVIADNINGLKGDTTKIIEPTDLKITNKISEAFINETYFLSITTYPEDSSFKSYTYESSDSSIAKISSKGKITFLAEGNVTITASNYNYPEIKDSFSISVKSIKAESVSAKILKNEKEIVKTDEIYMLELGSTYQVLTEILPDNTTNKKVSYSLNTKEYIKITSKGTITPLKYSNNQITTLQIKIDEVTCYLQIIIVPKDLIDLESLKVDNHEIYVNELKYPEITFYPNNATFKNYTLSSNSNLIEITDKNLAYIGKEVGTAEITISSVEKPEITYTFIVTILPQVQVESFIVPEELTLTIGDKKQIKPIITPTYAVANFTYSYDSNIIAVSEEGIITALNKGTTKLAITTNEITNIILITVNEKIETNITEIKLNTTTLILKPNINYNLEELIYIEKILTKETIDLKLSFTNSSINAIENNIFNTSILGYSTLDVIHDASGISQTIIIIVIDDFHIQINDLKTNAIDLIVNGHISFAIVDNNDMQNYSVSIENKLIGLLEKNENNYKLTALASGTTNLIITPTINKVKISEAKIIIPINITHIYTTNLDIELYDLDQKQNLDISKEIIINLNQNIKVNTLLDEKITISQIKYILSDENILTIDGNGTIKPNNTGTATITITEEFSNISKSYTIKVINYYKLKDEQVLISGDTTGYDIDKNQYYITNGNSGKLNLNFEENSTYTLVTYHSSNEKIITVGQDGTITPIKKGTANITLTCYDGVNEKIEVTIKIEVKARDYIQDMNSFLYTIRKSIGHYGAFLVLGIFSTLTFMLYFTNKKWLFAVPINFIQGFGIAALTEYIQTFIPGRYGAYSDVMIDYAGFLTSAILITAGILLYHLIKYLLTKIRSH